MMAYAPAGVSGGIPADEAEDLLESESPPECENEISRFARLPLYLSIAMFAMICIVVPIALGFPLFLIVGGCLLVGCLVVSLTANDAGRRAPRYASHGAYCCAIGVLGSAVFQVGVNPVVIVYCSGVMMLAGAQLLGARVTIYWSIPTMGLAAATASIPQDEIREVAALASIVCRDGALLTMVALAVAFRRANDRQSAELLKTATTDALTGLANRRALGTALTDALHRSARFRRQGALVSIDLDGLKAVNDTLGHEAGDVLIDTVATRIGASVREIDTAARLGGDEFVVLLADHDVPDGAEIFARRLLTAIAQPFEVAGEIIEPSASIGIAHFPGVSDQPDAIMQRANEAMYRAKRAGGRRIVTSDDDPTSQQALPSQGPAESAVSVGAEGKSAPSSEPERATRGAMSGPSRLPVYCAVIVFGLLTIALPLALGLTGLGSLGTVAVLCLAYSLSAIDTGRRAATYAFHVAYLFSLAGVVYAVFILGLLPVLTVYIPAMLLLAAAHLLGARAAFVWLVPTLGIATAAVLFPPAVSIEVSSLLLAFVRSGTLFAILAFSVAFRQSYDEQSNRLRQNATTDPLTGLSNRRAIVGAIDDALARASRHGRGALVMIDVDGLKSVNDRLGHEAGDDLLRAAANRIAECIRDVDTAARMGGDEFVVLLAEYDVAHGAEAFARRLLGSFSEPCLVGGEMIPTSASLGIAYFSSDSVTTDELLQRADEAMYQAKRAGGSRIVSG